MTDITAVIYAGSQPDLPYKITYISRAAPFWCTKKGALCHDILGMRLLCFYTCIIQTKVKLLTALFCMLRLAVKASCELLATYRLAIIALASQLKKRLTKTM